MQVVLMRHAEAQRPPGLAIGQFDVPLSETGLAAAVTLAGRWPHRRPTRIVTSDLERARETAKTFAKAFQVRVRLDADWREASIGMFEGRPFAELEQTMPDALDDWYQHWRERGPPGGESWAALKTRVARAVKRVYSTRGEGPTLVVAHLGSIRAAIAVLRGDDAAALELPLGPLDAVVPGAAQH